jgi:hypothetical protein
MNRQLLLILLVGVLFAGCTVRIHAQLTSQRTVMI